MTVFFRVFDPVTDVVLIEAPIDGTLNYNYGLNSSAQFSGEFLQAWPNTDLIEAGYPISIYTDKTELLSGNIQRLDPSLGGKTKFTAVGRLDSIYDEPVFALGYYDTKPLLGILVELLYLAGWVLGNISTLDSPNQVTTIDLRSEANLLTQINKLLAGVPEVFYREGELILGSPSLDIGLFLSTSQIQALAPSEVSMQPSDNENIHWVTDLTYQEDITSSVYAVRALGGNVKDSLGVSRTINLGDALSSNVNLLLDANFPIIETLAEQSWMALNYETYGRVGGRILSTVSGAVNTYVGDNQGAGVEENFWAMQTFVPIPGYFESFSLWFGAVTAAALGFNLTWVLQEISLSDYRTVIADNLLTGTISTTGIANTIQKIVPSSQYELVRGKLYGIAIGFDFNPAPDIFIVQLKTRVTSTSYSFRQQRNSNGKITTAGLWGTANSLGFLEVVTSPIDAPLAGVVGQTAAKYAPKNAGANATLAETQAAGLALYLWTQAYLKDRIPDIKTYNLSATGTKNFPKAGDTIYVNSRAQGQYQNPITGEFVRTERLVAEDLRVDKVQATIVGDAVQLSYSLLNGTGLPLVDSIVSLYDKTENAAPAQGEVAARPWALLLDTLTGAIGPFSPNSVMSDGTLAYRVSFSIFAGTYASRPNDVEEVYMAGLPYGTISPGGDLRVEMVQMPTIANATWIFDIALKTRDWEYGDVATITVKQVWR